MLGERGKAGGEEDDLQEKKLDLEMRYKKLELQLHNLLDRNEGITEENKGKDVILSVKEKELHELTVRNGFEMEQLGIEQTCLEEDLQHQLETVSGQVVRGELQKERYQVLQEENVDLIEAIENIREDLSRINEEHSKDMHRMNAFMQVERVRMENLFRSELLAMDMAFQNQAFLELDDDRKQAMFANTKLKDELGLLSVGLSALGVRYEKDTRSAKDTMNNLENLEKKGRELQTAMNSLMSLKVGKRDTINNVKADIKLFKAKKVEIDVVVKNEPSIPHLEKVLYQTNVVLGKEERAITMWKERKRLLNLLKKEFKTVTFEGGQNFLFNSLSHCSSQASARSGTTGTLVPNPTVSADHGAGITSNFKEVERINGDCGDTESITRSGVGSLTGGDSLVSITTMNSSKRDPRVLTRLTDSRRTFSGINPRSLSINDKNLKKGLHKLIGKESMLLDAHNADPEVNITAWVTAQIVDIFSTTAEQWQIANDAVESQLVAIAKEAEKEELRLKEIERQEFDNEIVSQRSDTSVESNFNKITFQVSDDTLEKVSSKKSVGEMFIMAQSSSEESSDNEEDIDEDSLYIDQAIDEIIEDIDQPQEEDSLAVNNNPDLSPLILDTPAIMNSNVSSPMVGNEISPPSVHFENKLQSQPGTLSPAVDSTAPTVLAGSTEYYANLQTPSTEFKSPLKGIAEQEEDINEFDKNGLRKSYSANEVIQKAAVDRSKDNERRSSYIGFKDDNTLNQLLADSKKNILQNAKLDKGAFSKSADFRSVKPDKKVSYLDSVAPPLASRRHFNANVDISDLIDPRCSKISALKKSNNSKSDSKLSKSQQRIGKLPSRVVASSSNLGAVGGALSSNQFLSSDLLGKKDLANLIASNSKRGAEDPLSGKSTRALQKRY